MGERLVMDGLRPVPSHETTTKPAPAPELGQQNSSLESTLRAAADKVLRSAGGAADPRLREFGRGVSIDDPLSEYVLGHKLSSPLDIARSELLLKIADARRERRTPEQLYGMAYVAQREAKAVLFSLDEIISHAEVLSASLRSSLETNHSATSSRALTSQLEIISSIKQSLEHRRALIGNALAISEKALQQGDLCKASLLEAAVALTATNDRALSDMQPLLSDVSTTVRRAKDLASVSGGESLNLMGQLLQLGEDVNAAFGTSHPQVLESMVGGGKTLIGKAVEHIAEFAKRGELRKALKEVRRVLEKKQAPREAIDDIEETLKTVLGKTTEKTSLETMRDFIGGMERKHYGYLLLGVVSFLALNYAAELMDIGMNYYEKVVPADKQLLKVAQEYRKANAAILEARSVAYKAEKSIEAAQTANPTANAVTDAFANLMQPSAEIFNARRQLINETDPTKRQALEQQIAALEAEAARRQAAYQQTVQEAAKTGGNIVADALSQITAQFGGIAEIGRIDQPKRTTPVMDAAAEAAFDAALRRIPIEADRDVLDRVMRPVVAQLRELPTADRATLIGMMSTIERMVLAGTAERATIYGNLTQHEREVLNKVSTIAIAGLDSLSDSQKKNALDLVRQTVPVI